MNGNGRAGRAGKHPPGNPGPGSGTTSHRQRGLSFSATALLEEKLEQVPAEAAGPPSQDGEDQPKTKPLIRRRRVVLGMAAIVLAAIGVAGGFYYGYASTHESTDDAFIEGRIVQIGPKVAGQVVRMNVTDNQVVKQGDTLLEIDPRDFER